MSIYCFELCHEHTRAAPQPVGFDLHTYILQTGYSSRVLFHDHRWTLYMSRTVSRTQAGGAAASGSRLIYTYIYTPETRSESLLMSQTVSRTQAGGAAASGSRLIYTYIYTPETRSESLLMSHTMSRTQVGSAETSGRLVCMSTHMHVYMSTHIHISRTRYINNNNYRL